MKIAFSSPTRYSLLFIAGGRRQEAGGRANHSKGFSKQSCPNCPGGCYSCSDQGLNQQKGKLLSPEGNSRIRFGNLRKQKGKLLTHFSRFRKQKGKSLTHFSRFRKQKGKLLTHFSRSRIHFSSFCKQTGKWLAHFSNFRIQDDSFSRENLF